MIVRLRGDERLPLTCTRQGTCCHGKDLRVNPWEIAALAAQLGLAAVSARDRLCRGGFQLAHDSTTSVWRDQSACRLYDPARGCTAHAARPLACRLFPLGREQRAGATTFLYEGRDFPCLAGCPDVRTLPSLSVQDYLAGQDIAAGTAAQDAYGELLLDLGEAAMALADESGVAANDPLLATRRQRLGACAIDDLAGTLPDGWFDTLTAPMIEAPVAQPDAWITAHAALINHRLDVALAQAHDRDGIARVADRCLALALHLARGLGMDASGLAQTWAERVGE